MPKVQTQKDQKKETLMRKIAATKSNRACIILDIADKNISEFLVTGSQYLDIKLIEYPQIDDI